MTMDLASPDLARQLAELPPLPAAVSEIIQALRDEGASMSRCVELIEHDPALAARALRLANSPFYGRPGRIGSINSAVMMLGLRTVMGLLTSAALQMRLPGGDCPGFDREAHWAHAMETAMTASQLAPRVDLDPGEAFLAGLLHDIGALMLAVLAPEQMGQVLARTAAGEDPLLVERELLGTDHRSIGAEVSRRWNFPPSIVEAIADHHRQIVPGQAMSLADLLATCDALLHPQRQVATPADALALVPGWVWQQLQIDADQRLPTVERLFASRGAAG